MKQLLIILLFSVSSFCNAQKKAQPQFIEFVKKVAHPELELATPVPLYISTVELNLPLPDIYAKRIEHEKKLKPTMSATELDQIKQFYLGFVYSNLIIDRKLFDRLHDYILKNNNFFAVKPCRPGCLIVVDNKSIYLPQSKMRQFYKGLKSELLSNKCDTRMLSKIEDQFTITLE